MLKAACLLTAANGQDLFLEKNTQYDADVIIIGAGWSGMAAADHLHKNGVTNLLVLEGADHTGGRTTSIEFGSESVGKFNFEQGSNWVCGSGDESQKKGSPSVTTNPVKDLMLQENLQVAFIPGATDGNMSNYYRVYDEHGVEQEHSGELQRRGNEALACLAKKAEKRGAGKETVREGLSSCGWKPSTDAEWAMDWAIVSDESGVLAKHSALSGFGPDPTYEWWGADDWLVVDQHPRGFARLIDGMVRDSVPPGDFRVKLNAKVSKIAWGEGVTISTEDGRTFTAKHAISTMSLGVLRKHHEELFEPDLPAKASKDLVDDHFPMCNLTHVLIQFPEPWWDNSIPAWVSANEGGKDSRGNFTVWHNLNMEGFIPGSNTLLSFLGDPQAGLYGAMSEAEIMPILMERLRAQNPSKTIPEGTAAWLKNWGEDPLHYGAYSNSEPGVSYKREWAKPLKNNRKTIVDFAGEATCDNLNGYTHGALASGKAAAARYLHEFENGPNPETNDDTNLCNFYYYSM